jgi:hypothetical protein
VLLCPSLQAEERKKQAEEKRREKEIAKALAQQEKAVIRLRQRDANSGPPDDLDLEWEKLCEAHKAAGGHRAPLLGQLMHAAGVCRLLARASAASLLGVPLLLSRVPGCWRGAGGTLWCQALVLPVRLLTQRLPAALQAWMVWRARHHPSARSSPHLPCSCSLLLWTA